VVWEGHRGLESDVPEVSSMNASHSRGASLVLGGKIYRACVQSVMVYSEFGQKDTGVYLKSD